MARIGMLNVLRVQKAKIELSVAPEVRPFLGVHRSSTHILYHKQTCPVLQNIAQIAAAVCSSYYVVIGKFLKIFIFHKALCKGHFHITSDLGGYLCRVAGKGK